MKKRLLTPGPTQTPDAALLAMARPVGYHRSPEFIQLFGEVIEGLKYVFDTTNDVLVLSSSGTGGMEAAVTNTVPRGGKAIVLDAGRFAQRWTEICAAYGIETVVLKTPWGEAVDPDSVRQALAQHPDAVAVFGTLMESSTGVVHDIEAIGKIVRASKALWIVDAISGAGCIPCRTDTWGIDVLVVGSQKALMIPPGLAMVAVSERAWRQIEKTEPQAFYFNLQYARKALHTAPPSPWTPAFTLITALAETLREIRATGLDEIHRRVRQLAQATRAGVQALGLELFARRPADGMSTVRVPAGLDGKQLLKRLESRFGIKLAGGQAQLQGQIFRIAHFGQIDAIDILSTLAALEMIMAESGLPVTLGSGVAAAQRVLLETSAAASTTPTPQQPQARQSTAAPTPGAQSSTSQQ